MQDFVDQIGVITGAGTGIGRALAQQLVQVGCHVSLCDINADTLKNTIALCQSDNPHQVSVSGTTCDVADEAQVTEFYRHTLEHHQTEHINLLINNAGISGGGSFVNTSRQEWERTFNICWSGVYLVTRTFLPALLECKQGHVVNMSSANGLRAVLGGQIPHTAYSSAKFAVRGFTESLIHDFRFNAPHLKVSLVLPGHVGSDIIANSAQILEQRPPMQWNEEDAAQARRRWQIAGREDVADMTVQEIRQAGVQEIEDMQALGLTPTTAAEIILDGVRREQWRIIVGADTQALDALVRQDPEHAYDPDFVLRWRAEYAKLQD